MANDHFADGIPGESVIGVIPMQLDSKQVAKSGSPNTYRCQIHGFTPAALATDVLTLTGSATKRISINRIEFTADSSGAAIIDVLVYRRGTPGTGGTSTAPNVLANDSTNPYRTALLALYTANPTINDAGRYVSGAHYELPSNSAAGFSAATWVQTFGSNNVQKIILNGTKEQLCIGFNGQTIPNGLSIYVLIEWTED